MVLRGSLKHLIFMWWGWGGWRGGNQKQYIGGGELPEKGGTWTVCRFKERGACQRRRGWCF